MWASTTSTGLCRLTSVPSLAPKERYDGYFEWERLRDTPRERRLARMLDRGYEDTLWVEHWMAAEEWYLEHERPWEHADLVLGGG